MGEDFLVLWKICGIFVMPIAWEMFSFAAVEADAGALETKTKGYNWNAPD